MMGLLSWIFPSADDRVAAAKKRMSAERWADARLDLMGLDHPEAAEMLKTCENELAQMNLNAAVSWAAAGDEDRVQHHMEVARNFHTGGLEDAFKNARREMRDLRAQAKAEAEAEQQAEQKRLLSNDPLSGRASWRQPGAALEIDGDDEASARIALVIESYPASLRKTVGDLGAPFAQALLDFEDGRADLALQAYLALPDDQPVVRYERARTAYAMGDSRAAARELRAFHDLVGHHEPMGRHHTGSFLALCLAESGEPKDALKALKRARKREPNLDGGLYAQLLQMNGELGEAESVLRRLLRDYSKDSGLYRMLANVHVAADERMKAMTVLESGIEACTCKPGTCGFRPPDQANYRLLATLYLEDELDLPRGMELAAEAQRLMKEPTWEDAYLQALVAARTGHPDAAPMAGHLLENTPPNDPRRRLLEQHLTA